MLLAVAILLVLAVHGALAWLDEHPSPRGLTGDEQTYEARARAIHAGGEPPVDLLWPPLYPRFLAAVYGVTGPSPAAVRAVQTLLLAASALLLGAIARRLGASRAAAAVLVFFTLAYPPLAAFAHYLWPEILHLFFFSAALWLLVAHRRSLLHLAVAGGLLGLALLTKSLLGPFLPVLLLPLLAGDDGAPPRRRVLGAAVLLLTFAAATVPTVIDHGRRTGRWVIAGSATFNLWVGLNDRSRKSLEESIVWPELLAYRASADSWPQRDAELRRKIRAFVAERGAAAVLAAQLSRQPFRLFDKDSYLTEQLPGGLLSSEQRGYQGSPAWLAGALRGLAYGLYALLLAGVAAGVAWRSPRGRPWLWVAAAFLVYNLAVFLLLHVKSRYRIQMFPCFGLYLAFAVDVLRTGSPPEPRKWLTALALGSLLLFLAFAGPYL